MKTKELANELTIKCVVRFGGFVKISEHPWQLMVEIGLVSSMYLIILLICDFFIINCLIN